MRAEFRRAFFALWPPPEVAARLHALGKNKEGLPLLAGDLHLTLAFMGDVDAEEFECLRQIAASLSLPRASLSIRSLNYWPHNQILWAAPEIWPPELADFVTDLRAALTNAGFKLDVRDFVPHVTLLRKASADLSLEVVEPVEWPLEGWSLAASAKSDGLRYRRLAEWAVA
ncbi:RNA 2',3'-cyclic phosphodiesterase [Uliginosibacterium aquaticum]|uniref:RNA 2',3'-cyclic phosphodiesterase n=1 Tax=Uliginosibacterium aquaticum TaxID=2731212 RepID=UPI002E2CDE33|nr:RNA 2',3'-cyclic phosphodiesterase [Uliginosibacterium aquaticum]